MHRPPEPSEALENDARRADKEPEISDELFQLAKYAIVDFAIILMDASASIKSWNAGAERIFQYTENEVLGKSANLIFTLEDRLNLESQAEIDGAMQNGRADDERWHVRKDGSRFMASGVLTALRDRHGNIRGFAKVLRDVTDRLKADAILQQARHYDTLAVLAGGVAHDFNNLLTSILGNTSLALDRLPMLSPARELLEAAVVSSHRGAELTRRLLAYAGTGRFVCKRLELSQLVSELLPILERSVPPKIHLDVDLAPGLPEILADPMQIDDVILNLVVNGAEAMAGQPGTILISTGSAHLDRNQLDSLNAAGASPGEFVYCQVADPGTGMDDKTMARIFEPFFTTKFLGRGLGLAAVSGIVRQCKGAIRVTSRLGEGATFQVFFPAQPLR